MHITVLSRLLLTIVLLANLLLATTASAEQFVVDAFGDSITSGHPFWPGMNGNGCLPSSCNGGYEPPLQAMLRASGRDALVQNWGKRGDTSVGGLARIDAVLVASKPRYILLLEGTNELYFGSHYTVKANLSAMIDKARARGAIPVLGTFPPDLRYPEKNIPFANILLKQLAQDKKVALADHYAALKSNWRNLCWTDLIHPNEIGYSIMARVWAHAMQPDIDLTPIYRLLLDD